jgi:hypothetical protein
MLKSVEESYRCDKVIVELQLRLCLPASLGFTVYIEIYFPPCSQDFQGPLQS